jgi:2-dehydro-3-deoxygluconokinase
MGGVIALGECMVEVSLLPAAVARIGYAGDVFNTSVYLRRLGQHVRFASALGTDDPFSQAILHQMAAEGIGDDMMARVPGRLPGLYAIERDAAGERRFFYWREQAPFRQLFDVADLTRLRDALRGASLIYLSGISMAVLGETGRACMLDMLADAHGHGVGIAFDPNYRARLWPSAEAAQASLEAIVPLCRIVSVSSPDLEALYDMPLSQVAARWASHGAEVVTRDEDRTVEVHTDSGVARFPPQPVGPAVDTTGAGDSFNAAYLATRLAGGTPEAAVANGRRIAAAVVQGLGAIIPIEDMPPPAP